MPVRRGPSSGLRENLSRYKIPSWASLASPIHRKEQYTLVESLKFWPRHQARSFGVCSGYHRSADQAAVREAGWQSEPPMVDRRNSVLEALHE